MTEPSLWVNTEFKDDAAAEFQAVKSFLGMERSNEVVRHLVHQMYLAICGNAPLFSRLVDNKTEYSVQEPA